MATIKIGINGFGRIGRMVFRAACTQTDKYEIVGINDLCPVDYLAYMLKYDTMHGQFKGEIDYNVEKSQLIVNGHAIRVTAEKDPANLKWNEVGAEYVVESTGLFLTEEKAQAHLAAGAKYVVMSAPSKDATPMFVCGVNTDTYAGQKIVSNASCTTNCLAPVALVVERLFGIVSGTMTTVHAYTNDQRILDLPHKDLRRARAAACNIIPTSTGAAQAVAKVVDFTAILNKDTDTDTMRAALKEAAEGELKGILAYSDAPLVSMDFKGNPHSSIVEAEYTTVQDGKLAKIVSWYDNEWGYSNRVADLIMWMKEKGF